MRKRFVLSLFSLWLASSAVTASGDNTEYRVQFDKPYAIGQRFELSETATVRRTYTYENVAKQPAQPPKLSLAIKAVEKVLLIEANTKMPTKVELTVKSFTSNDDAVVPEGTVIVVENRGDTYKCLVNGVPAEPDVEAQIRNLIDLQSPNIPHSDAQVCNPAKPVRVGDQWSPDAKQLAEACESPDLSFDASNITSSITFTGADADSGKKRLHFQMKLHVKDVRFAAAKGVAGGTGTIDSQTNHVVSDDISDLSWQVESQSTFKCDMTYQAGDGKKYPYVVTMEISKHRQGQPLPN